MYLYQPASGFRCSDKAVQSACKPFHTYPSCFSTRPDWNLTGLQTYFPDFCLSVPASLKPFHSRRIPDIYPQAPAFSEAVLPLYFRDS